MNVNIATKDVMKNKTSKAILNHFMRGRNLNIELVHEGKNLRYMALNQFRYFII